MKTTILMNKEQQVSATPLARCFSILVTTNMAANQQASLHANSTLQLNYAHYDIDIARNQQYLYFTSLPTHVPSLDAESVPYQQNGESFSASKPCHNEKVKQISSPSTLD